jgi:hypothetical protein
VPLLCAAPNPYALPFSFFFTYNPPRAPPTLPHPLLYQGFEVALPGLRRTALTLPPIDDRSMFWRWRPRFTAPKDCTLLSLLESEAQLMGMRRKEERARVSGLPGFKAGFLLGAKATKPPLARITEREVRQLAYKQSRAGGGPGGGAADYENTMMELGRLRWIVRSVASSGTNLGTYLWERSKQLWAWAASNAERRGLPPPPTASKPADAPPPRTHAWEQGLVTTLEASKFNP